MATSVATYMSYAALNTNVLDIATMRLEIGTHLARRLREPWALDVLPAMVLSRRRYVWALRILRVFRIDAARGLARRLTGRALCLTRGAGIVATGLFSLLLRLFLALTRSWMVRRLGLG